VSALHSLIAYLLPGILVLIGLAISQVILVSTGCLVGKTLNFFHIFETESAKVE
jgi:hypothetical protein